MRVIWWKITRPVPGNPVESWTPEPESLSLKPHPLTPDSTPLTSERRGIWDRFVRWADHD